MVFRLCTRLCAQKRSIDVQKVCPFALSKDRSRTPFYSDNAINIEGFERIDNWRHPGKKRQRNYFALDLPPRVLRMMYMSGKSGAQSRKIEQMALLIAPVNVPCTDIVTLEQPLLLQIGQGNPECWQSQDTFLFSYILHWETCPQQKLCHAT